MDILPLTNIFVLGAGIEACLEKRLMMPALALIYSGIDVLGWLASSVEYASRPSFLDWVENYLLKAVPLNRTALDLWGARCGILHTLTGKAKPMPGEQPRQICYAYSTAEIQKIQRSIDLGKMGHKYVAIHLDDLWEAWRIGVVRFMEEMGKDPEMKSRVLKKAGKFYSQVDPALIDKAIDGLELMERLGIPVEKLETFGEKDRKKRVKNALPEKRS